MEEADDSTSHHNMVNVKGAFAIGPSRASFVLYPIIYLVQIGLRYSGRFNGQTVSWLRIKQNKNDTSIRQLLGKSVFYIQIFTRSFNKLVWQNCWITEIIIIQCIQIEIYSNPAQNSFELKKKTFGDIKQDFQNYSFYLSGIFKDFLNKK